MAKKRTERTQRTERMEPGRCYVCGKPAAARRAERGREMDGKRKIELRLTEEKKGKWSIYMKASQEIEDTKYNASQVGEIKTLTGGLLECGKYLEITMLPELQKLKDKDAFGASSVTVEEKPHRKGA